MSTREPSAMVKRVMLYARTVAQLTPTQLLYWPLRRVQRAFPIRPETGSGIPDAQRFQRFVECVERWGPGDLLARRARADAVAAGLFRFIGHEERMPAVDWSRRYVSHLWTFNLHYFDYAVDLAWSARFGDPRAGPTLAALVSGWIAQTTHGRGEAWEPYTVAVRAVNWTKALAIAHQSLDPPTVERMWQSIHSQLSVLSRRLEHHLGANHLQRNYSALYLAGGVLSGREAEKWRAMGSRGLQESIEDQVLTDGCHVERSPMYHMIALCDFLEAWDAARSWREPFRDESTDRLRRMIRATDILTRANGDLHLFNDSANGVAPSRAEIDGLARIVLDEKLTSITGGFDLPAAGYYGFADHSSGERILVDCGEPGARHQPGHAHCDMLSFELDLAGRAFVVDTGTSGYAHDPLRRYQRSTRAHNTVEIAGRDQSEVWNTFRMARRARAEHARAQTDGARWTFRGRCRPFFDANIRHDRSIDRPGPGQWIVTDLLSGVAKGQPLRSFLHLHPDVQAEKDGGKWIATLAGVKVLIEPFGFQRSSAHRGERHPDLGWHAPRFGCAMPATSLEMEAQASGDTSFGYRISVVS